MRREKRKHTCLVRFLSHPAMCEAFGRVFRNTAKVAPLVCWRIADPGESCGLGLSEWGFLRAVGFWGPDKVVPGLGQD